VLTKTERIGCKSNNINNNFEKCVLKDSEISPTTTVYSDKSENEEFNAET